MAEHKLVLYFILMLSINVVLFLAQGGVEAVNADAGFWTAGNSSPAATFLHGEDLSGGFGATDTELEDTFVTSESVEPDTGNIFTDTIKTVRGWFTNMNDRFGILKSILTQPYGFLKDVGVPLPIATAFAVIWYMALMLLIVSFIKGGSAD